MISAPITMALLVFTVMPWPELAPQIWNAMRWLPTRKLIDLMLGAMDPQRTNYQAGESVLVMLPYVAITVFVAGTAAGIDPVRPIQARWGCHRACCICIANHL